MEQYMEAASLLMKLDRREVGHNLALVTALSRLHCHLKGCLPKKTSTKKKPLERSVLVESVTQATTVTLGLLVNHLANGIKTANDRVLVEEHLWVVQQSHFLQRVLQIIELDHEEQVLRRNSVQDHQYALVGSIWLWRRWEKFEGNKKVRGQKSYRYFAQSLGIEYVEKLARILKIGHRANRLGGLSLLLCNQLRSISKANQDCFESFVSTVEGDTIHEDLHLEQEFFHNISDAADHRLTVFYREFELMADGALQQYEQTRKMLVNNQNADLAPDTSLPATCQNGHQVHPQQPRLAPQQNMQLFIASGSVPASASPSLSPQSAFQEPSNIPVVNAIVTSCRSTTDSISPNNNLMLNTSWPSENLAFSGSSMELYKESMAHRRHLGPPSPNIDHMHTDTIHNYALAHESNTQDLLVSSDHHEIVNVQFDGGDTADMLYDGYANEIDFDVGNTVATLCYLNDLGAFANQVDFGTASIDVGVVASSLWHTQQH